MRLYPLFVLCIFCAAAWAKNPNLERDLYAIQEMQNLSAHTIDSLLPATPFRDWMQSTVGDSVKLIWEINDCGEQTGSPSDRDVPMCVNVVTGPHSAIYLSVTIVIGTAKQGLSGKPVVLDVSVAKNGRKRSYMALSDLLISSWK